VIWLFGVRALQRLPHLLLTLVVRIDRERHELVERHTVVGIDVEQLWRDGSELEPLLHDLDAHEVGDVREQVATSRRQGDPAGTASKQLDAEPFLERIDPVTDGECSRDLLLAHALLAQCEEGTDLVERVQRRTLDVLRKRVLLREPFGAHDTGDRRGAGKALLLHQKLERTIAPPAGRDLEHAGLGAVVVEDGPDGEALQECAARDVVRKLFDRDARLDAAHVRLAQHQLVEGNVNWLRVIFCVGLGISDSPQRAAESLSLDLLTRHEAGAALFLSRATRRIEDRKGAQAESRTHGKPGVPA
jgi:hypothetical protein